MLLLCALGYSLPAQALLASASDGLRTALPLDSTLQVLRVPTGQLTDADVLSGARDAAFAAVLRDQALDCRDGMTCWMRFTLSRAPDAPADWMVHLRLAQPGAVVLYAHERTSGEPVRHESQQFPLNWRFASSELMFAVTLHEAPTPFYLQFHGVSTAGHLALLQQSGFAFQQRRLGLYLSVSLGVTLTLLAVNLIFWRWLKDVLHLYFALMMFAAVLMHLWQLAPWMTGGPEPPDLDLQGAAQYLFQATTALFVCRLFEFRHHAPRIALAFHAIVAIDLLAMLTALFGHFRQIEYAMSMLTLLWAAAGMLAVVWLIVGEGRRHLLAPAAIMLVPALVTVLARVYWLGWLTPGTNEGPGAAWLALRIVFMLLLTILVANRTQKAERDLLRTRRRALDDALRAERELELKVQQRTQELAHSNALLLDEVARRGLAESNLQDALETERKAVAQQRQFVAMASHEFRTPLAVIGAAAGSIDLVVTEHAVQSRTAKIQRAVTRLSGLIENFLAEDRMHIPGMGLKPERFDLRALAHSARDMLARQSEGRLEIRTSAEALNVLADRSLIEVALQNLVQNALKYSSSERCVTVTLHTVDGKACVDVGDRGPGIPLEEHPQLFDKFFRGATARTTSGSGLGLYLVQEIARQHGGEVTLAASGPQGSTFRFTLPLAPPDTRA